MDVKLLSISGNQNSLRQLVRADGSISNTYLLKTDAPDKIKVSREKLTGKIKYVDPAGGPRITVGKTIRDTDMPVVTEITYNKKLGYIITF
jgi:hypothetical protein